MAHTPTSLAEVKCYKLKDCPVLTAGHITPLIHQAWSLAARRYQKHGGIDAKEIVSYVAMGMMEPRLIAWYQADSMRIDTLTLDVYLAELGTLVLDRNWQHRIREEILLTRQETQPFMHWKIAMENLNAILTTSAPTYALTKAGLKVQLEANLRPALRLSLATEPVLATELAAWALEVKDRDDRLADEEARIRVIMAEGENKKKKDLFSRLGEPRPSKSSSSSSSTPTSSNANATPATKWLPKLTQDEKDLLKEHDGCTRCRKFYTDHPGDQCPMVATKTWPDPATTKVLTVEMANAAAATKRKLVAAAIGYDSDEVPDLNEYTDSSDSYVPFSSPHLIPTLDFFGPKIQEFPKPVTSLLDVGCPTIVISDQLVNELGLRRFDLPKEEDNLASLSKEPLRCREWVRLEMSSGNGAWKSRTHRAKVCVGLPIPIILGMSFLSAEHIVIDTQLRTARDKRTGYDLMRTDPIPAPLTIPPTTKRKRVKSTSKATSKSGADHIPSEPPLAGYLCAGAVFRAVRERIKTLTFQETLIQKDLEFKQKYADRFPLRLPDTLEGVPNHIFHCIRLKDPSKVTSGRGYNAPRKYHAAWKALLEEPTRGSNP
jgi:hypothetical protein